MHRRALPLLALWLLAVATLAAAAPAAAAAERPGFRVRYRSAETVYLEAGRLAGLAVGDRLEVVREGEVVAVLEIVFTADHSSSAKLVEERAEVRAGDLAYPLGELRPPPAESAPPAAESPPPPAAGERPQRAAPPPPPAARRRATRVSGVAALDWESYSDEDGEREVDRSSARLSLRGRDLGGLPLDLAVRLRRHRVERSGDLGAGVPASEDRDRLYELSLRWAPDSEAWSVEVGRLGAGPFSGIGYLDGASGRVRLLRGWELGAFYGQRPELAELGFDSAGSKVGIFSRWAAAERPWEVFVAGVEEEDEAGTSRRVAVLETRLARAGGRWSLYQRAEVDLTTDGAASEESGGQLTQAALVVTGRLGERSRVVISYDRYDPVLLFDDPDPGPAQRFEDLLRQGLRARLDFGRPGGPGLSISGGVRAGEGDEERTYTVGLGAHSARLWNTSLSGDLLGFSNPLTEGALLTLRARHAFTGGHSLGLSVGSTLYSEELTGADRTTGWARLDGWVELPLAFFLRGEVEVTRGDDAEGRRLGLGLGYRF